MGNVAGKDKSEDRVLIIDDNLDDIELTKIVLSEQGRNEQIETALDGRAALNLLRMNNRPLPSLILLDLKMPGMSGIDTLRQIRADERLRNIPVVVVTSSALETDEAEAYNAGADCFLHKAFNIDLFGDQLTRIMQRYLNNN